MDVSSVIPVLLFLIIGEGVISQKQGDVGSPLVSGPLKICPHAEDITPCVCINGPREFSIDCSAVQQQDRLIEVFQAHFPHPEMSSFYLNSNKYIKVLGEGLFVNTTFQEIHVRNSELQNIQQGVILGLEDTLVELDLFNSHIDSFQVDLSSLTILERLQLDFNYLRGLPELKSDTLTHLSLGGNLFSEIPSGSFDNVPALTKLSIEKLSIEMIQPGLFDSLLHLSELRLDDNNLTSLTQNAINLPSSNVHFIDLYGNPLAMVEPDAINVGGGKPTLYLGGTQLHILEEAVWRPLLEKEVQVLLAGLDLSCGCELSWLVEDAALLRRLPMAACTDGRLLTDLNPEDYAEC
ncbi:unnamed protein product [Meganyctiphanes norvegica]|uniref:Oplophorus-luciferin 2-monooxygenase non-catalytic subunit n=1 Tax=Meganyctiphanes norvegica TaxID=48144 RepID=A0AAV2RMV2_MEGNR